jgi:hypothetical protein
MVTIDVTGVAPPPPIFFNLGIVGLVTELNNGKLKMHRKKKLFVVWGKFSPL